jgi:hypothetical protein
MKEIHSEIEKIIREQTGIGPLVPQQANYLQVLIRAAFHAQSAVLVMYIFDGVNFIYLMPTNGPDNYRAIKSTPLSKSEFDEYKDVAEIWLEKLLKETKDFAGLTAYYTFKIVRTLPKDVKEGEKIAWQ